MQPNTSIFQVILYLPFLQKEKKKNVLSKWLLCFGISESRFQNQSNLTYVAVLWMANARILGSPDLWSSTGLVSWGLVVKEQGRHWLAGICLVSLGFVSDTSLENVPVLPPSYSSRTALAELHLLEGAWAPQRPSSWWNHSLYYNDAFI